MVNTYACKHATPTSKNVNANTTKNGIIDTTVIIPKIYYFFKLEESF